jgi:hypothetical protein
MELHFLGAGDGVPLTKKFKEVGPGQYEKTSFPHVINVVSIKQHVNTLEEMRDAIETMSEEKFCLLKGCLDQQLENEPRAGHTNTHSATEWLCLDIDFDVTDYETPRDFLEDLDPEFKGVSFIYQHSASHGITSHEGWRGHIYVWIESPQSPQMIKQWLIERNLTMTNLKKHLSLSASGLSLRYPLDTTTCQNDKLIYIARPQCENFEDPIKERIELDKGTKDRAYLNKEVHPGVNQQMIVDRLAALRLEKGLEKKKANTENTAKGLQICKNPDPITISGKKEARGFVYLNFNGGDSWGYFFPIDRPELIHNFKGEPLLRLKDIAPDLYAEYAEAAVYEPTTESTIGGSLTPLAFREIRADAYFNGWYDPSNGNVELWQTSSKAKLKDFLIQFNEELGPHIADWTMNFDPANMAQIDISAQWVNMFRPTEYLRKHNTKEAPDVAPEVILKVLMSLCVTEEVYNYFINWLAAAFQRREKLGTAWIFQGVQGTGKGLLYSKILTPLFGEQHVFETTMERFDDQFNAYLERNLMLFIDEANVGDSRKGDRTVNKLKNLITEHDIIIRAMRSNPYTAKNYSNLVFASNQIDMIPLEASDRRFNVAPRQEKALKITHEEVKQMKHEMQAFANHLMNFNVDMVSATSIILTDARQKLIDLGETTVSSFYSAIRTGNLAYFAQFLRNKTPTDHTGISYLDFQKVVKMWMKKLDCKSTASREDLMQCYAYMQGLNELPSPTKFGRMCQRYGVVIETVKEANEAPRKGCNVAWSMTPEDREVYMGDIVIPFPESKEK